jgi:hypothetical protein
MYIEHRRLSTVSKEIVDGVESLSTFKYTDYPNGKDSRLESLPHLDILSTFDRTPHLSNADIVCFHANRCDVTRI